jgi:hypothetical protein
VPGQAVEQLGMDGSGAGRAREHELEAVAPAGHKRSAAVGIVNRNVEGGPGIGQVIQVDADPRPRASWP